MKEENKKRDGSNIDWELLFRQLKNYLLKDETNPQMEELLENESIWRQLPSDKALQWAEIAQASGKHDLGLKVLEAALEKDPHNHLLWEGKTKLLELLLQRSSKTYAEMELSSGDDITVPFTKLREMEKYLSLYMSIFKGKEDAFARQWVDRRNGTHGYYPVRRPLIEKDVLNHLEGKQTYGIYLLHEDNSVSVAVIDADCDISLLKDGISRDDRFHFKQENTYLLRRIPEALAQQGLNCFIEFSGSKGYHFWLSFESPVYASIIRRLLIPVAQHVARDLKFFKLEVFPKQDKITGKGFGNLVKLPLGIHQVTGKPSFFIHIHDRSMESQLKWLEKAPRITKKALEQYSRYAPDSKTLIIHPKDEEWTKTYPELALLSSRCMALGNIIDQCRQGRLLSTREEKVIWGTVSFLPRARLLVHYLLRKLPDYNQHLVDYKLSRVRSTPLGCKSIHRLLNIMGDYCHFEGDYDYPFPLLHLPEICDRKRLMNSSISERIVNLQDALNLLKTAILTVEKFLSGSSGVKE